MPPLTGHHQLLAISLLNNANETMDNTAYLLELFPRVITVSLDTLDIRDGLPELVIE